MWTHKRVMVLSLTTALIGAFLGFRLSPKPEISTREDKVEVSDTQKEAVVKVVTRTVTKESPAGERVTETLTEETKRETESIKVGVVETSQKVSYLPAKHRIGLGLEDIQSHLKAEPDRRYYVQYSYRLQELPLWIDSRLSVSQKGQSPEVSLGVSFDF